MSVRILVGDVRDKLKELDDESVHCVVTSPPYWGLRDYGTATWEGGDAGCDHIEPTASHRDCSGGFGGGRDKGTRGEQPSSRSGARQYSDVCAKCGARRVDSQLGLEATPEEHVENMVGVFREVRRVLRADGTLWLNYGDSYAANTKGTGGASETPTLTGGRRTVLEGQMMEPRHYQHGLKPKDLVGMPWSVAKALQAPYYTGKIRNARDRVWLAAAIDGEGCIFIHKRKAGQNNGQGYERKNASFGAGLEISNTSKPFVERCLEITGVGSICHQDSGRRQRLWRWNLRSNQCRDILREVYPDLVAKQGEARLAIGCPSSGSEAESAHESLIAIHNGGDSTIDFPEPSSMFEPGFYLRSDIIWSKNNPMPESVTDRPTKSHEHIFLLAKAERYFYDADAVREPHSTDPDGKNTADWERNTDTTKHRGDDAAYRYRPGSRPKNYFGHSGGRNLRDVWTIPTAPFPGAHFATFPPKLVEPCIKAGTSEEGCCSVCGAPRERETTVGYGSHGYTTNGPRSLERRRKTFGSAGFSVRKRKTVETNGWKPTCGHVGSSVPCTVLDPFGGAGTVGLVADRLGRDAVLVELNPEYADIAKRRIFDDCPLFAKIE